MAAAGQTTSQISLFFPAMNFRKFDAARRVLLQVREDGLPCDIAIDRGDSPGLETLSVEARESATWENQAKTDAHHAVEGLLREKDVPSANHGT